VCFFKNSCSISEALNAMKMCYKITLKSLQNVSVTWCFRHYSRTDSRRSPVSLANLTPSESALSWRQSPGPKNAAFSHQFYKNQFQHTFQSCLFAAWHHFRSMPWIDNFGNLLSVFTMPHTNKR